MIDIDIVMDWTVDFYKDNGENEPVRVFMDSLSLAVRAKITRVSEPKNGI